MIDRPVALVCTGHGKHQLRELAVLVPVMSAKYMEEVAAEQGLIYAAPSAIVERGFTVETSTVTEDMHGRRVRRKADARLINTPGVGWQVIAREGCPDCGGGLVQSVAVVAAHVAAHYPPDTRRVDVDIRPKAGMIG